MNIKDLKDCIDQSPLYGNKKGGKEFDDAGQCAEKALPFPCGVIVRKGDIIDHVAFAYDGFTLKHGGMGGKQQDFALQKNEYIVRVAGSFVNYGGAVTVKTLEFTTDKGRVFTVGTADSGDERFEFKAKEGYAVCAMYGRADNFVRGIGFYARQVKMDLGGGLKDLGDKMASKFK